MLKNLLLYRLGVVNLCMLAVWVFATIMGWTPLLYLGDASGITYIITLLFLVVLASTFRQACKISKDKNAVKEVKKVIAGKGLGGPLTAKIIREFSGIRTS